MVEAAVTATVEALGGVDILVCNAGIAGPTMPLWEYPVADWQRVLDIDLTGVFQCLRAVVPLMIAQNYGRIVDRLDRRQGGQPQCQRLQRRQGRVIALTKSLGKEVAGHDIAVNCITPAAARTGSSSRSASSTSTTCCPRSRAAGSSRSTRSPPWWPGWCRPRIRSPPVPCST